MLPPPSDLLGVSGRFTSWYPGQDEAFSRLMSWQKTRQRFLSLSIPTGSGKSLLAILAARLGGKRTVILTATKGLQDQIIKDFASLGVVNIKGKNNYACVMVPESTADDGPCNDGMQCQYKSSGCPYHDQLRRALEANVVVTNYAYYIAQTTYSTGLGPIDLLVMDEAHLIFGAVESHLQQYIAKSDINSIGVEFPVSADGWEVWKQWAIGNMHKVGAVADNLQDEVNHVVKTGTNMPAALKRAYRNAKSLERKISTIAVAKGKWVAQKSGSGWRFTPVWVADYVSRSLFRDTRKIVLMSAILSDKTLEAIGVNDSEFVYMDSAFLAANTPIWHVPSVRMNHRIDDYGVTIWSSRIDQIISRRLDRKGIVFTVSYARRDSLVQRSKHLGIIYSHTTRDVVDRVSAFKRANAPAVLVSPSVTSGWDFPGDECSYIIIGKIPYPDTRDPVMQERLKDDKEWSSFVAMETVVQEAGRGTRSKDDKCEVLIVDDSWKWFWPKYQHYAPAWFVGRVRGSLRNVPDPLV